MRLLSYLSTNLSDLLYQIPEYRTCHPSTRSHTRVWHHLNTFRHCENSYTPRQSTEFSLTVVHTRTDLPYISSFSILAGAPAKLKRLTENKTYVHVPNPSPSERHFPFMRSFLYAKMLVLIQALLLLKSRTPKHIQRTEDPSNVYFSP